jgi:hypothetical protein
MLEALSAHDCLQICWNAKEIEAQLLQHNAVVLLGQRQDGRHLVHIDVLAQLVLTDQLQPLDIVPVRGDEKVLVHGNLVLVSDLWQQVCVQEGSSLLHHESELVPGHHRLRDVLVEDGVDRRVAWTQEHDTIVVVVVVIGEEDDPPAMAGYGEKAGLE